MRNKILLIMLMLMLFSTCSEDKPGEESQTVRHLDKREYIFYKPQNLPANAPLVFVLHGYTSGAWIIQWYSGMDDMADANGFAVCYPQGSLDQYGIPHWNARLNISETDDIGFLTELAEFLQTEHDLDPERTFACGMSNGGYMSYTLACEAPDIFKAIASITGTMSGYTWDNCDPTKPVPVLQISGVDDDVVPIDGSMGSGGGWGGAPHMDSIITYWSNLNECTTIDTVLLPQSTRAYYHSDCMDNHEVRYYKIDNWGHEWPASNDNTGTNADEVIGEFFSHF